LFLLPNSAVSVADVAAHTQFQVNEPSRQLLFDQYRAKVRPSFPVPTTIKARPADKYATPVATPTYQASTPTIMSTPTPTYTPPPSKAPIVPSDGSIGARLLAQAETMQGVPYVWAGDTPTGFDCSGLIYWAAAQIGIQNMPRDTYGMLDQGVSSGLLVPTSQPAPGDLAFFGSGHVELVTSQSDVTFGAQQPGKNVGFNTYYPPEYAPTAFYRVT
jgi:cell wall-associated NlpC family hydrolase